MRAPAARAAGSTLLALQLVRVQLNSALVELYNIPYVRSLVRTPTRLGEYLMYSTHTGSTHWYVPHTHLIG